MLLEKILVLMSRLPSDSDFAKRLEVFVIDICEWILIINSFLLFPPSFMRDAFCSAIYIQSGQSVASQENP